MLIVDYNFRSLKVQTTPSTLLSKVRDEACTKFGLDHLKFTLSHASKPVDLTLPVRFTSLVNGAKLTLTPFKPSAKARVKLRLTSGDYVGTFDSFSTIASILAAADMSGHAFLNEHEVPSDRSLLELGVNSSVVFSVRPQGTSDSSKPPTASAPAPNPASSTERHNPSINSSGTESRSALVYIQQNAASEKAAEPSEVRSSSGYPDEPTVAQSRIYMEHLRSQATPKPLISRTTQQNLRQEKRKEENITIRIRLPDMSSLEGVFRPNESGQQVFDFIKGHLVDPSISFSLETVPPGIELKPNMHLIDDTDFEKRVLLKLVTTSKGPFLNEKAINIFKARQQQLTASTSSTSEPHEKPKSKPKAVPKWLKLGK